MVGRFIWVGDCLCSNHNNLIYFYLQAYTHNIGDMNGIFIYILKYQGKYKKRLLWITSYILRIRAHELYPREIILLNKVN